MSDDFDLRGERVHASPLSGDRISWDEDEDPNCDFERTEWDKQEEKKDWRAWLPIAVLRLQSDLIERREEFALLQDLQDKISSLEDRVSELSENTSLIVPITGFAPEPYDLLQEIKVVLEPSDGEYIASFFDANVNAQGCNQQEAFENLKETILSRFEYLDTLDPKKLGPVPSRQIAILRTYLRRR